MKEWLTDIWEMPQAEFNQAILDMLYNFAIVAGILVVVCAVIIAIVEYRRSRMRKDFLNKRGKWYGKEWT